MATQYLPSSGTIGLGQARDQWNQPGSGSPNTMGATALGGYQCRQMAEVPSGPIKMSDLYAKARGAKMTLYSFPYKYPSNYWYDYVIKASRVGVGAFQREVINIIFPFAEVMTYTVSLGSIIRPKIGNVTIRAIGDLYCAKWPYHHTHNHELTHTCIQVQIDGIRDPEWAKRGYPAEDVVIDTFYPSALRVWWRRNGGGVESKTFARFCLANKYDRDYYDYGRAWYGHYYHWNSATGPFSVVNYTENVDYGESSSTVHHNYFVNGYGSTGQTCNQAGQPGGNKMWQVPYYAEGLSNFQVGETLEIIQIDYWW